MLIHRIKKLPYKGANLAKEFVQKIGEEELADKMKAEYGLVKNSCGYSIRSIQYQVVQLNAQILARKIMRKCCADKVPALVVSLVAQCVKGVKYNW